MKTIGIIAGVAAIGALFWYYSRRVPGAVLGGGTVTKIAPPTLEQKIQSGANTIGWTGGGLVAKLVPGTAPASNVFAQQGKDIVGGTVQGFRTSYSGLNQVAHGNVLTGASNIGLGAAQTAYSATGAKSVVNLVKSIW